MEKFSSLEDFEANCTIKEYDKFTKMLSLLFFMHGTKKYLDFDEMESVMETLKKYDGHDRLSGEMRNIKRDIFDKMFKET